MPDEERPTTGQSQDPPLFASITATPGPSPFALNRIFLGDEGLRAGWSALLFLLVLATFAFVASGLFFRLGLLHASAVFNAPTVCAHELAMLIGLLAGAALLISLEPRGLRAFPLCGPRMGWRFVEGLAAGFLFLSLLIGAQAAGGWMRLAPAGLAWGELLPQGALWACAFLLVSCFEEGLFRCCLLPTLARGVNFWWALGGVALLSALAALGPRGAFGGVLAAAALGLAPCWALRRRAAGSGFWPSAWLTSVFFGFVHTGNAGETALGVFTASLVGMLFCASIRLTGSVAWAVGCHLSWDWAESFFYGAANSGNPASGRFLAATPAGGELWSGGSAGPEGSLLAPLVLLLLYLALRWRYARRGQGEAEALTASAPDSCAPRA